MDSEILIACRQEALDFKNTPVLKVTSNCFSSWAHVLDVEDIDVELASEVAQLKGNNIRSEGAYVNLLRVLTDVDASGGS